MLNNKPRLDLAKKLNVVAYILTAVVLLVVGGMRQIHIETELDFSFLPGFHSSVNAACAISLIVALYFVKRKQYEAHRNAIYVSMGLSVIFLVSYVLYHTTSPEVRYCGEEGILRTVYFILLISHVVLAGIILPLILFTFIRAFTYQFKKHKSMARWVFPIWLYVAISGPLCYLMLRPCF